VTPEKESEFDIEEEQELKKKIEKKYSEDCITLTCGQTSNETRWALMAISDIWAMTSLRQGYTLVILPYSRLVSFRIYRHKKTHGIQPWRYHNEHIYWRRNLGS